MVGQNMFRNTSGLKCDFKCAVPNMCIFLKIAVGTQEDNEPFEGSKGYTLIFFIDTVVFVIGRSYFLFRTIILACELHRNSAKGTKAVAKQGTRL